MPVSSAYTTINGREVIDPKKLIEYFTQRGLPVGQWWGKANRFICPVGPAPGVGYVLVRKAVLDKLDFTGFNNSLQFTESRSVNIEHLAIISPPEAVTGAAEAEADTVYLVELHDKRAFAKYGQVNSAYNVMHPGYANRSYFKRTLKNNQTPWTWQTLIDDLASKIPIMGGGIDTSAVSLPTTLPEGYDFQGCSAWDALIQVAHDIQCVPDLDITGTFRLLYEATETMPVSLQTLLSTNAVRIQDQALTDKRPLSPEKVAVYFIRRDHAFQLSSDLFEATPKTYQRNRSFYEIIKTIHLAGSETARKITGCTVVVHDSLQARYTSAGVLENLTELDARAQEIAERLRSRYDNRIDHRIYTGVIPFFHVSSLAATSWYDIGKGVYTEIVLAPSSAVEVKISASGGPGGPESVGSNPITPHALLEYPGPNDMARLHVENEFTAVVRPTEPINPRDARDTYFRYGTLPTNPNDPQIITWNDSAPHHTDVHNASTTRVALPGEQYFAIWHQQVRKWLIIDGEQLILVRATEFLDPGKCCNGTIGIPNDGEWAEGPVCIIQDGQHKTFLAPNVTVWAKPIGTTEDGVLVCEAIGENGLHQVAKALTDVDCGNSGVFQLARGAPDLTIPSLKISDKTASEYYQQRQALGIVGNCQWGNQKNIFACPEPGTTRKIFQSEYVILNYNPFSRVWYYRPKPQTLHGEGTLASDMCQNGNFVYNNVLIGGDNCTNLIEPLQGQLAVNRYGLQGKAGQLIYTQFDGVDRWWIVQSTHEPQIMLQSIDQEECDISVTAHQVAVMSCSEPAPILLNLGVDVDVITHLQSFSDANSCKLRGTKKSVKVLCVNSTTNNVDFFSFQMIDVIVDVYDDGECVYQVPQAVFVGCIGEAGDDEVIFCTTDCEQSGSGSQ